MKKIILASNSPRRKEILSIYTDNFSTKVSNIDETINPEKNLKDEISNLSYKKAYCIFKDNRDAVVIGADTIVVYNNEILGKPKDEQDAYRMLKILSNNVHEVITATTIIDNKNIYKDISVSKVYFKKLDDKEIFKYIETKEPMDKAGAYGIQGYAGCFINKIEGDFYSIMGMPLNFIYTTLENIFNNWIFVWYCLLYKGADIVQW